MQNSLAGTIVATAALLAWSSACSAPTKMTDPWRDPSYRAGPMENVVVVGLRVAPVTRRLMEDRVVSELSKRGVHASPSYAVLGEALPDREALARRGFDGALVLRLHDINERSRYVPNDRFFGSPYNYYWGASAYDLGYVVTDQIVEFETSLWDLRDGKRVWTANARTENPSSSRDFAKSLSQEVAPELSKQGLIAK